MGGIDLHTHSRYSDGTFTPAELFELARERDLATVALTDHDTIAGLPEAREAGDRLGIEVIPGVELSTVRDGEGVHMLCYFMDPQAPAFGEELRRLQDDRFRRGERMVEKLQDLGHPIEFARVREIAEGGNIIRPHVAQALVEAGVVPTVKDAFSPELIGSGGRAYVEKHALDPADAIPLVHGAGGVCVLAHPGTWREASPVPDALIEELIAHGLDGIEAAHPEHTPELQASYQAVAADRGLIWTGSSDCHGTRYDPVRLGMRTTPPEQLARLREAAGARRSASTR